MFLKQTGGALPTSRSHFLMTALLLLLQCSWMSVEVNSFSYPRTLFDKWVALRADVLLCSFLFFSLRRDSSHLSLVAAYSISFIFKMQKKLFQTLMIFYHTYHTYECDKSNVAYMLPTKYDIKQLNLSYLPYLRMRQIIYCIHTSYEIRHKSNMDHQTIET